MIKYDYVKVSKASYVYTVQEKKDFEKKVLFLQ